MAADTLTPRPTLSRRAPTATKPVAKSASKNGGKPAPKKPAAKPAAPKTVAAKLGTPKAVTPKPGASKPVANEATETLQRTRESVSHMSGEYVAICTDTLSAAMETGSLTSKLLAEINQSYMDACTGNLSAFAEIGRDSLACRTPADLMALQQKAAEAVTASVNTTSKLYGGLFAIFSQAMDPLMTRASHAPQRLFKALAD